MNSALMRAGDSHELIFYRQQSIRKARRHETNLTVRKMTIRHIIHCLMESPIYFRLDLRARFMLVREMRELYGRG